MFQNLFTGRIVQNVVEIIILFVLFSYHNLKIRLSVFRKDRIYSFLFYFLGLRDPHYQEIRCFLCWLEIWGRPFIKFGKSSNERRYRE